MKNIMHFYVKYWSDFSNTYRLGWCFAESKEERIAIERGWERITRKEAIGFCRAERYARKYDESFSGYGDSEIYPLEFDHGFDDIDEQEYFSKDGYIYTIVDVRKLYYDERGEILREFDLYRTWIEDFSAEERGEYGDNFREYLSNCMYWSGGTLKPV